MLDHTKGLVSSTLARLDAQVQKSSTAKGEENTLNLREASLLSAKNDPLFTGLLLQLSYHRLDQAQAESIVWPRLDLQVGYDQPIAGDNGSGEFTGGVFARYDIWKAIFSKDLANYHVAEVRKTRLSALSLLKQKSLQLFLLEQERRALLRERKLRDQLLALATNGRKLCQAYAGMGQAGPEEATFWSLAVIQEEKGVRENESKLEENQGKLQGMLGTMGAESVSVNIPEEAWMRAPVDEGTLLPSEVWKSRDQARVLEMELVMAELAVLAAEREMLPNINLGLGLGQIPLGSTNETSSAVLQFGVSMPLLDFGDHRRKVAKAKRLRDQKKIQIEKAAISFWREAQVSHQRLVQAKRGQVLAERLVRELEGSYAVQEKMTLANQLGQLALLKTERSLLAMKIEKNAADLHLLGLAASARVALGKPLIEGLTEDILQALTPRTEEP